MRGAAMRALLAAGAGLSAALGTGSAAPMPADVTVSFDENVPTDSFRIANTSLCNATVAAVTIDLAGSVGRLVFDTEAGGEGVNAFVPFGVRAGEAMITEVTPVGDGDARVTLTFSGLVPGAAVEFTIDVDDRLPAGDFGQAQVSGSEIAGATITATLIWPTGTPEKATGTFGFDSAARIAARSCAMS